MNSQTLIALIGLIAATGGIATGIVALRKVGTENSVALRTVAVTEADLTIEAMSKFIEQLRADNASQREENRQLHADLHALRETKDGRP